MAAWTIAAYIRTYTANARQLAALPIAGQWRRLGVDPHTAADWANAGFLPCEAAPLIADGITAPLVRAVEDAIGHGDELAALTLDLHFNGDAS